MTKLSRFYIMILCFDLSENATNHRGLPIPPHLKKYLTSWGNAKYREYDFGYILTQKLVTRKFSVFLWSLQIHKAVKLYAVCDKPTITLYFTLQGNISFELAGFGKKLLNQSRAELLYIPKAVNEILLEPRKYESLYIEMYPGFLEDAVLVHQGIQGLLERQRKSSAKGKALDSANMNYVFMAILKEMRQLNEETGSINLEMQTYILELLVEYIHETNEKEKVLAKKNMPNKKTIIAIKDHIMQSPHIHDYPVKGLAKLFTISQTTLKANFKTLFGLSVGRFVHFHAMTKAHYLLATTDRSIDDIACEIGYPYRINFDKAFEREFRYKPTEVRKDQSKGSSDIPDQIQ